MSKLKDGLIFIDPKNSKDKVIFNFHSWVEIVKAIMIKYGDKTLEDASEILEKQLNSQIEANNYQDVIFIAHEVEYHWAMLFSFGELYWHHGVSSIEPNGYFEWEAEYRRTHNLAEESFVFEE